MLARLCFCSADGWQRGICFHGLFLWGLLTGSHSHICKHFAFCPLLWLPSDQPCPLKSSKRSTCAICVPVPCHRAVVAACAVLKGCPPPLQVTALSSQKKKDIWRIITGIISDSQMDLCLFIHNNMIWSENIIFKILLNWGRFLKKRKLKYLQIIACVRP